MRDLRESEETETVFEHEVNQLTPSVLGQRELPCGQQEDNGVDANGVGEGRCEDRALGC